MLMANLRHPRGFLAIAEGRSLTLALAKLEAAAGTELFHCAPRGFFANQAGEVPRRRAARAFARLDAALADISPRLVLTATRTQLSVLIVVSEARKFALAAARFGVSQPATHRAVAKLERGASGPLFQRSPVGVAPTRPCVALAQAARLAFTELDQAVAELAECQGREVGAIVVGAMPLARPHVLPRAPAMFRESRPRLCVQIVEGSYVDLLSRVRRGEIDVIIGALRDPAPVGDVIREHLFNDTLALLAAKDDSLVGRDSVSLEELRARLAGAAQRRTGAHVVRRAVRPCRIGCARELYPDGIGDPDAGDGRQGRPSRLHLACAGGERHQPWPCRGAALPKRADAASDWPHLSQGLDADSRVEPVPRRRAELLTAWRRPAP